MAPVKKTTKKPVKEESSSSEDEQVQVVEIVEKPVEKTTKKQAVKTEEKTAPKAEEKVTAKKEKQTFKAPEKKGKWEELSNDGSEHDQLEVNEDDYDDQPEVQKTDTKHGPKRGARYEKSATNFDYAQYANLSEPINELNSRDLMKVLIVRSYNEGQHQLCKTLKQTLRAMNLECEFPFGNTARREQHATGAPRTGFSKPSSAGFERRNVQSSPKPYSREERQDRRPFRKNENVTATYDM